MPQVDSPILLDFARCRVLHGETLIAELDLVTGTDTRLTDARTPLDHTHVQDATVLDRILTDGTGNVLVDGRGDVLWN